jgi:hypothetical protein
MLVIILCIAIALATATSVLAARYRRERRRKSNPLAHVFRLRELAALDAHLEAVARDELHRLEGELARYLAGRTGHIETISRTPSGIALELSDGRCIALRGISLRTLELLRGSARMNTLRPESVDRDVITCCLLLRGSTGAEVRIHARNIALAV